MLLAFLKFLVLKDRMKKIERLFHTVESYA